MRSASSIDFYMLNRGRSALSPSFHTKKKGRSASKMAKIGGASGFFHVLAQIPPYIVRVWTVAILPVDTPSL